VACNAAFAGEVQRVLAVTAVPGMPVEDVLALGGTAAERARELCAAAFAGERVSVVAPFGDPVHTLYEVTIGPLRDADGTLNGVWTIGRNVHEREVESALERERLRTVLDALPIGVWIADATGRFTARNRAGGAIWGEDAPMSQRAEDYGKDYIGWWPDGRRIASDEWGLARALRGELALAEEVDILSRDGLRKTVLNYALPIRDTEGRVAGGVALNVDITERKALERAHEFLSDASTLLAESMELEPTLRQVARLAIPYLADYCVVDVLDHDGVPRRVAAAHVDPALQPVVERLLEFPPTPGSQGLVARVMQSAQPEMMVDATGLDPLATAGGREELARLIVQLAPRSYMCLPMVISGSTVGSILLVMSSSGRHYRERDQETGLELARRAAAAVDNARHHTAEQAARREAEAASLAKSRFLATMSHELRTPLTGIIGYTELLDEEVTGPLTPRQKQQLSRIKTSAWHLVTIIDQILLFARAEAGREEVRLSAVDLVSLVHESVAIVEPQARAKGLTLEAYADQPHLVIETDQGKVRQILLNLVGNAVKFTDEGSVRVHVASGAAAAEIRVQDTGPGVAQDQRERIFDAFTQVDSSNTRAKGGTGLGLTVSRRLAELLGGALAVESAAGSGSTFVLRLPRHAPLTGAGT
jgi:PAS domain S-box-containing protein